MAGAREKEREIETEKKETGRREEERRRRRWRRDEPRSKRVEDLLHTKSGGLRANWMLSLGSWGQSTLRSVCARAHFLAHTYVHTIILLAHVHQLLINVR